MYVAVVGLTETLFIWIGWKSTSVFVSVSDCLCALALCWNVSLAVNGGGGSYDGKGNLLEHVLMGPVPSPEISMATATRTSGYCIPELHSERLRQSRIPAL